MAARLFERVCGRDARTLEESLEIALEVLGRRIELWDAAEDAIRSRAQRGRR
jgi:hypothetical protein